jgi:hypothetical protein
MVLRDATAQLSKEFLLPNVCVRCSPTTTGMGQRRDKEVNARA